MTASDKSADQLKNVLLCRGYPHMPLVATAANGSNPFAKLRGPVAVMFAQLSGSRANWSQRGLRLATSVDIHGFPLEDLQRNSFKGILMSAFKNYMRRCIFLMCL